MKPVVYIDVIVCGQIMGTMGFEQPEGSNIFSTLNAIENVYREMKRNNQWDNYRINHICAHGNSCPKIKDVEIIKYNNP